MDKLEFRLCHFHALSAQYTRRDRRFLASMVLVALSTCTTRTMLVTAWHWSTVSLLGLSVLGDEMVLQCDSHSLCPVCLVEFIENVADVEFYSRTTDN